MSSDVAPGSDRVMTPIVIKTDEGFQWLEGERVFYVLARNGLFLCREHPFFRSSTRARLWPRELVDQERFLIPRFPRLAREDLERVVGFFDHMGRQGAEAAVLLAWNPTRAQVEILVPPQTATITRVWSGRPHPVGLHFDVPHNLPPGWFVFGDIHSHVELEAYASGTDQHDETFQAGLHAVVGRIHEEPPQFHVEAVAEGDRFTLLREDLVEAYEQRRTDFPQEWIERVAVQVQPPPAHGPQGPVVGGWGDAWPG